MNIRKPEVLSRYGARLLDLWLGAVVAALLLKGATLDTLLTGAFALTLVVLTAKWVITVLNGYADTGDIPEQPPAIMATLSAVEHQPPVTIHNHIHMQPEPPPPPAIVVPGG